MEKSESCSNPGLVRPNFIFRFWVGNSPVVTHTLSGWKDSKEEKWRWSSSKPLTTWKHIVVLLPRMEFKFFCLSRQLHDLKNVPWRSWGEIKDSLGSSVGTWSTLETQVSLCKRVIWVILRLFSWEFHTSRGRWLMKTDLASFFMLLLLLWLFFSRDQLRCSGNEGGGSWGGEVSRQETWSILCLTVEGQLNRSDPSPGHVRSLA